MIERSLVLIKPDGVARGLIGEIITRFEKSGMKLIGMKMLQMDDKLAEKHYSAHIGKPFYAPLVKLMTSSPLLAFCIEGVDAIENVRKLVGATEPKSSLPGTIRGDYSHISYEHADEKGVGIPNLVHASGDKEDAKKEVAIWFTEEELMKYEATCDKFTI